QVTSWSRSSKSTGTSSTWVRHQQKKPSEVSGAGPAHACAPNPNAAAAAAAAAVLFTLLGCLLIYRLFISPEKEPSLSSSANRAVSVITAKPLKEHG
ncbi:unnamed protein product, partial [Tetraodon nigroviridis]